MACELQVSIWSNVTVSYLWLLLYVEAKKKQNSKFLDTGNRLVVREGGWLVGEMGKGDQKHVD